MQTTVGDLINHLSQLDLSTVMVLPPSLSALVAGTTTPIPAPAAAPAAVVAPAVPPVATTAATQGPGVPSPTVGTLPITAFAAVFRCPTCDAVHFMTPINNPPVSTSPPHTTASPAPAVVPAPPSTPAPAARSTTVSPAPAVVPAPPSTPAPASRSTTVSPAPVVVPAPPSTPTPTPAIPLLPSTPSFPLMSAATSSNFGTPPSTPGHALSSTAGNNGRWYAVTYGRQIGVFRDWYGIVEPLVANVPHWKCRGFSTLAAATAHFNERVNAGAAGIYVD
ncbi:hypothetical protein PC9H_009974 [Pleurotus ostreatus]|uniref:Ribonuclease H1 N-terminal domain-containing protein n=1 Tax=Pleurotus ostreatus TaxID=5322 RepID=A0A8H6ZQD4_PLEOS|nr:uncharacterized protein PC9H_009974 [Pleurotus ostreatus]KAF7424664.1 hypothetical protein PC9H_009974 [Pleurotus ostreatus]KAJ8692355.1 hypothetical protein PTI98_009675 [Pleurotus ostreatus]